MNPKRRYFVHLPNEKKLELKAQPKSLGRELLEHVLGHFKIEEKQYFGIGFKSASGHYAWIQENKKLQDHDLTKTSRLEFYFAFQFFVDSVVYFKHCLTVELLYLHLNSLIYKGLLEVKADTVFQLAAFVLQINFGNHEEDSVALENLRQLALLPEKILQQHSITHCESCILKQYKELTGISKGKAILQYIMKVESAPAYGVHFYKVKEKSGKQLWLGLSFKGVFVFELNNRSHPIRTFYWKQIENLCFHGKKFSIEVIDILKRRGSADARSLFSVDPVKNSSQVKVHSWYGSTALVKILWQMSTAQHKFFLDTQRKAKVKDFSNLTNLANDLTNNNNTLIKNKGGHPEMTLIKSLSAKTERENEERNETPEMLAVKQKLSDALKARRTELEDKLFEKVQELKKVCLQEADIIGKYPPEYVRYMNYNEKLPKIKRRVGAEFKVKLRNKEEREFPSTVTTSSSSSGISSSGYDPTDELTQLEQEFDILTQIANAAKKLANDVDAKRKTKKNRWKSFKKTVDKLQVVEVKMNTLREKIGQQPSIRASMLITEEDELMFEDGKSSFGGGTESERSSLSEGYILGDSTSVSSGDMLATQLSPESEKEIKKRISSSDMDIVAKTSEKRSLTPPPSLERISFDNAFETSKKNVDENVPSPRSSSVVSMDSSKNVNENIPSPRSSSGVSMDSSNTSYPKTSPRNWHQPKWSLPRAKQSPVWKESSLDSIDTASTTSRRSEDSNSLNSSEVDLRNRSKITSRYAMPPIEALDQNSIYSETTEEMLIEELIQGEKNQKYCKKPKTKHEFNQEDITAIDGVQQRFDKIQISVSSTDAIPSVHTDTNSTRTDFLKPFRHRKRSSSLTESSSSVSPSRSESPMSKNGTLKSSSQPQYLPAAENTYNVQNAFKTTSQFGEMLGLPGSMTKSRSSQELQPSIVVTAPQTTAKHVQTHTRSGSWLHGVQSTKMASRPTDTGPNSEYNGYRVDQPPTGNNHTLKSESRSKPHWTESAAHDVSAPHSNIVGTTAPQLQSDTPVMTSAQRDMLNNEVYQDIGMGWVPSLSEYSCRASVCESASILSRKEDIVSLLRDHLASKPRATIDRNHEKRRKMREQYQAIQQQQSFLSRSLNQESFSSDKTWANYRKQPVYSGFNYHQNAPAVTMPSRTSSVDSQRSPSLPRRSPPGAQQNYLSRQQTQNQPSIDPQALAAFQDPRLFNTVQHPGQLTDLNNAQTGLHGNHELEFKQQILLRHYMHHAHDHVRTNHATLPTNQKHYVHASTNQQHGLKRQANTEALSQTYPSVVAPSNAHQHRSQPQRWISQQSELRHASSNPPGLQELSSTSLEDAGSVSQFRSSQKISPRGSDKNIPASVAKKGYFLNIPQRGGHAFPKSAPSTPYREDMNTPPFPLAAESGLSVGGDAAGYERTFSRRNQQQPNFQHENSQFSNGIPRTPSADRISSSTSIHSTDGRLLQQHPAHRSSPSFHHAQSSPALSLRRDSRSGFSTPRGGNASPFPNATLQSTFHPGAAPQYMDPIAMAPTKLSKHPFSIHKSSSSPVITSSGGGTLPRSSKSKNRMNPDLGPESAPIYVHPHWTSMEQGLDRRLKRRSLVLPANPPVQYSKPRLHSVSEIPDTKPVYRNQNPAPKTKRMGHSRSRSEAWSNHQTAYCPSIPLDSSRLILRGSNSGPLYHQPLQDGQYANVTDSLRRVKKQSASAEDLLRSPPKEGQAGTLV